MYPGDAIIGGLDPALDLERERDLVVGRDLGQRLAVSLEQRGFDSVGFGQTGVLVGFGESGVDPGLFEQFVDHRWIERSTRGVPDPAVVG